MFIFPAFMSQETAVIGVLLPFVGIPLALIAFVVWHVRKLNNMDRTLREILKTLKND